jgi:hypothetical protein
MSPYWLYKKYQALFLTKQVLLSIFLISVCGIPFYIFIRPEGETFKWSIPRLMICLGVVGLCYKVIPLVRRKMAETEKYFVGSK